MIPPKEFLRKIKPFSFLSEDEIDRILSGLEVEVYPKNSVIFKEGRKLEHVYLVFSGLIGLFEGEELIDYVSRGELVGVISSIYNTRTTLTARAIEDTVCYVIDKNKFREVFDKNPKFSSFFLTFVSKRFRSFTNLAREREIFEETTFLTEVEKVVSKKPVVCGIDSSVEDDVKKMEENKVGSIVVVDGEQKPLGIFTDNDLRRVVLYGNKSKSIEGFMSSPPISIDAKKPLFDAYTTMIDHGIDHLIITNDGRVCGVITSKDILSQLEPSSSVLALYRKSIKATTIEELKIVFEKMNVAVAKMALKGLHFYDLSRMITSVHDAIVTKTIEIVSKEYNAKNFVWIHMGSSGRREQIIATDQDNAIVHEGENLLDFAMAVNNALAEIGIPKCPANYMASNERWNVDIESWKNYFKKWFNEPIPDHIRYLSVFLDMRPIYGDTKLYNELLEFVEENVTNQAIRFLALDATIIEPPIGIFGIKHLGRGIDLKKYGIYPIANGVRVLALDNKILEFTSTKERIAELVELDVLSREVSSSLLESYEFIQDLRLKHQSKAIVMRGGGDNIISVKELDKLDLLVLKESLKIVSSFQKLLKNKYAVERGL
ncbi:hypothetical protein DRP05_00390 [Archaeoglobales archaeon]|nr:MAG: hypothetical protein DRP05_00390 [Archaeoglobales archaeon]